mgnify:CR=1 FL=1
MSETSSGETPAEETGAERSSNSSEANGGSSPGTMLAAARQGRELSLDEVGDALNLAPQSIEWLETDNFDALPAAAFTQGYIRNYAKLVGLDADKVVAAYQAMAGKPAVAWESPRGNAGFAELVQRHPGMLISVVVAAVVLLIVIVLAVVWPSDGDQVDAPAEAEPEIGMEVAPNRGTSSAAQAPEATTADKAAPDSSSTSSSSPANAVSGQLSGQEETSQTERFDNPLRDEDSSFDRDAIDPNDPLAHLPVAKTYPVRTPSGGVRTTTDSVSAPEEAPEEAQTEGRNYQSTVSRRLTPTGSSVVRLEVTEDCWISVKDVAENELFAMLGRTGQTINLTGDGPFRVLLGYAPGASLYFNDRQIRLAPYTRNNVASLVIGQ